MSDDTEYPEGTVAWIQVRRNGGLWDGPKLARLMDVWDGLVTPELEWWEFGEELSLSGSNIEVRVLRVVDVGEPPEWEAS